MGLGVLLGACEDKPKDAPPTDPRPPAPALSALGIDAAGIGEPLDPPAPAGDLKGELDRFVNLDTCVAERAKLDPVVGDALNAIGYETFLRDACRLLEAAKDRKRDSCDRIDSSALRTRCLAWVAIVAQTPDACPLQFEGLPSRGRNASCVAIAAKDPRLCAGEARTVPRATCEAMVVRDPARCDALLPNLRPGCQREVTRWKSLLPPPLEGFDKLPEVHGKLALRGASGTPDPPSTEIDLSGDLQRGVVVVTARDRMRIELGTVVESEAARIAASPQRKPRLGLALVLDSSSKSETGGASIQKLEVDLPSEAPIVSPPATCDCKFTKARGSATRGGTVAFALEGTVTSGTRSYKLAIDVTTWARDVVPDNTGSMRVLPPVHPAIPGLSARDGG